MRRGLVEQAEALGDLRGGEDLVRGTLPGPAEILPALALGKERPAAEGVDQGLPEGGAALAAGPAEAASFGEFTGHGHLRGEKGNGSGGSKGEIGGPERPCEGRLAGGI